MRVTAEQWRDLRYFRADELVSGRRAFPVPLEMRWPLLQGIDAARHAAGVPFVITSSFRPGDSGAHGRGWAVDIRAHDGMTRRRIVLALVEVGCPRIGVYDRHVHADYDPALVQGVMWGGKSE
jgi:hypothetical protein